jgi:hypothetical protein
MSNSLINDASCAQIGSFVVVIFIWDLMKQLMFHERGNSAYIFLWTALYASSNCQGPLFKVLSTQGATFPPVTAENYFPASLIFLSWKKQLIKNSLTSAFSASQLRVGICIWFSWAANSFGGGSHGIY